MGAALGDVDGDADLEALAASWDKPCRVWSNDGTVSFSDTAQAPGSAGGRDVALADLGVHGDLDAFVTHGELGRESGDEMPNEIWLNTLVP